MRVLVPSREDTRWVRRARRSARSPSSAGIASLPRGVKPEYTAQVIVGHRTIVQRLGHHGVTAIGPCRAGNPQRIGCAPIRRCAPQFRWKDDGLRDDDSPAERLHALCEVDLDMVSGAINGADGSDPHTAAHLFTIRRQRIRCENGNERQCYRQFDQRRAPASHRAQNGLRATDRHPVRTVRCVSPTHMIACNHISFSSSTAKPRAVNR